MATIPAFAMRDLRFLLKEVRTLGRSDLAQRAEKIQKFIAARRRHKLLPDETCGDCDGVGWVEGGETLKTTCTRCKGTGVVPRLSLRESKAIRKTLQKLEDERLRAKLIPRTGGQCELAPHQRHRGCEPHHLIRGSGKRREQQSEQNTMWSCRRHHEAFHDKPADFREVVLAWCEQYGYPVPPIFRRDPR